MPFGSGPSWVDSDGVDVATADGEAVLANCDWLVGVARRMGVPVVVSEQ